MIKVTLLDKDEKRDWFGWAMIGEICPAPEAIRFRGKEYSQCGPPLGHGNSLRYRRCDGDDGAGGGDSVRMPGCEWVGAHEESFMEIHEEQRGYVGDVPAATGFCTSQFAVGERPDRSDA